MFLEKNYELPKAKSSYMRFQQGDNKFRVVSSAITGYEYFSKDNKPVRQKNYFDNTPVDIKDNGQVKHFWAFAVIDRWDDSIKILEVTQRGIMKAMKKLTGSPEWGDPKGYDINVYREGEGLETTYSVQPEPHKKLTAEEDNLVKDTHVNLEALYEGDNPFEEKAKIVTDF